MRHRMQASTKWKQDLGGFPSDLLSEKRALHRSSPFGHSCAAFQGGVGQISEQTGHHGHASWAGLPETCE